MQNKSLLLSLMLTIVCSLTPSRAQDVDCSIRVNFESVPTTNKELLLNFESDVKNYVNNYKWGPDNLDEKIKCTMEIFIQSVVGENRYSAQVFVGSSRPIYNGTQTSAVLRLKDETWEFTYVRGRPINHTPYTFDDFTSFLDFYVYLIIGYDYDTYDNLNGTPHFKKAADIASLGRSGGGKGWQPSNSGYNRVQLIEEILNTKFAPVRTASYIYHYAGLDSMAVSSTQAYKNIVQAIMMIGDAKRSADVRNQIIRVFFDTKYKEIAELFIGYPDPKIYLELQTMDPSHQTTYEEYRKKTR